MVWISFDRLELLIACASIEGKFIMIKADSKQRYRLLVGLLLLVPLSALVEHERDHG